MKTSIDQSGVLEKLNDSDLTNEEREAFEKAELEFKHGETVDFEDLLTDLETHDKKAS